MLLLAPRGQQREANNSFGRKVHSKKQPKKGLVQKTP